jgi:hypothetical protein
MRTLGKNLPRPQGLAAQTGVETRSAWTAKPALVSISKQVDGRSIVLEINGAQSPGDGVKPGTSH